MLRSLVFALSLCDAYGTGPRTGGNQTIEYLVSLIHNSKLPVDGVDPDFECSWRQVASL